MKDRQQGKNITTVKSLELDISLIDEDPDQPRKEFDPVTLQELADTIRRRGVKTPISVRPNPDSEGRFIINHGARRFRASKLAKKKTIPAFIDGDYSKIDQVIENIQRDSLTPREISEFIAYQSAKGLKQIEIAKMIGKSRAFIYQYNTLLNLPISIKELFDSGEIKDVSLVTALVNAHKESPEITIDWINSGHEITHGAVKLLRQFIKKEHRKLKYNSDGSITNSSGQRKEVDEFKYRYTSNELLSLFTKFQKRIISDEDISLEAIDSLGKGERDSLSAILNKLISFNKKLK